ncbi:ureidoglycolate hydrolase [Sphaerosporella brunnea]|uniref:Ureidoglycolate hydrolase n=1 Tax=Sphaerosporella brunnea TaxID=1250544 RepID=A0A5J5F0G2_9PEZI|nr:ureidoglycolate hydrolase [Sphaerosporella brunnea]
MAPPTLAAPSQRTPLPLEPLTPSAFTRFGTAIQKPDSNNTGSSITANQGTASKHARISPVSSFYPPTSPAATTNLNLFVCAPRRSLTPEGIFHVKILERHPYTTQTFIPLSLSSSPDAATYYVVIVAPTGKDGMPVLEELRAFRARGDQAVTYSAGTWHAPMVVVGERPVEFCVLVAENGTALDCEEVFIGGGGVPVKVVGEGNWGLWEKTRGAKL